MYFGEVLNCGSLGMMSQVLRSDLLESAFGASV